MPAISPTSQTTQDALTEGSPQPARAASVLAYLAVVGAVVAAAVLLWAPLTTTITRTSGSSSSGEVSGTVTHGSLLESEGSSILVVLSIPVLLTIIGLVAHRRVRMVTAILLIVGCLLGLMSIGVFFVPSAILAVIAAVKTPGPAR